MAEMTTVNGVLTLAEAAHLLRKAPKTLRQPEWRERVQARKVGGRWLVPAAVVYALIGGQP